MAGHDQGEFTLQWVVIVVISDFTDRAAGYLLEKLGKLASHSHLPVA
jgi:hypothetical protein